MKFDKITDSIIRVTDTVIQEYSINTLQIRLDILTKQRNSIASQLDKQIAEVEILISGAKSVGVTKKM